jgi:hypothetical protein
VQKMAQHYWLSQRAQRLQDLAMGDPNLTEEQQNRQFALFLRYQTTNDRAFHHCLNQLLKLRTEKRRAEIGFESQQHKKAQEVRRDDAEKRRQELHQHAVLLAEAKVDHQIILNSNLEFDRKLAAAAGNHPREAKTSA